MSSSPSQGPPPSDCATVDETYTGALIGFALVLAILLSYTPQHLKIILHRSADGISPWFLLCGSFSSLAILCNGLALQIHVIGCCISTWTPLGCTVELLKILQLGAQWLSLNIVFILVVCYAKPGERLLTAGVAVLYVCLCAISLGTGYILVYMYGGGSFLLLEYGDFMGAVGLGLVLVQYIPQLYTVIANRDVGSYSIATLMLQCPGTFVWTTFLATGHDSNISTWLPNFITACMQLILICVGMYFSATNKESGSENSDSEGSQDDYWDEEAEEFLEDSAQTVTESTIVAVSEGMEAGRVSPNTGSRARDKDKGKGSATQGATDEEATERSALLRWGRR
eukprot:Clim_evm52s11 gene=Clim_evmTU52s11